MSHVNPSNASNHSNPANPAATATATAPAGCCGADCCGAEPAAEVDTAETTELRPLITPRADILETDSAVLLVVDLPGVAPDGVEVTLEKDLLTIHGRAGWSAPAEARPAYAEFALGDYERSFRIGDAIDRDKLEGTMKDGVLRLTLPKAAPAQPKKIAVRPA